MYATNYTTIDEKTKSDISLAVNQNNIYKHLCFTTLDHRPIIERYSVWKQNMTDFFLDHYSRILKSESSKIEEDGLEEHRNRMLCQALELATQDIIKQSQKWEKEFAYAQAVLRPI